MTRPPLNTYIEHTDLRPDITSKDVEKLVAEAKEHAFIGVCVPPYWVKKAKRDLGGTDIQLVTVIGFPLGYNLTEAKLAEAELAIKHGANELDLVLNQSAIANGSWDWVKIEVVRLAKMAHEKEVMLKAILETAMLTDEQIVKACEVCTQAGADFVKTSTGFAKGGGATVEAVRLMHGSTPDTVGVKASGGIRTADQALAMIEAGAERIGASSGVAMVVG